MECEGHARSSHPIGPHPARSSAAGAAVALPTTPIEEPGGSARATCIGNGRFATATAHTEAENDIPTGEYGINNRPAESRVGSSPPYRIQGELGRMIFTPRRMADPCVADSATMADAEGNSSPRQGEPNGC